MGANCEVIVFPPGKSGKISKWKVREGMFVSIGRVLLLYDVNSCSEREELRKLKATQMGMVRKLLAREGETITPGTALLELEECTHPTVMNAMCAECGADLKTENENCLKASVPMVHCIPELKVSREQAQLIGKADEERLLNHRKLVLLVDLDQTLIHTTNDNIPPNIKDVYHFQLYGPASPWYHTRIRPGTQSFLREMTRLYELHICTFGARNYAHMIAKFLDPDGKYFSHRILSRDECFNPSSKTANLSSLFPCGDNMVCIIDDREDVWNFAPNLIHVKPYHFFKHTGDINAPPGLTKHENDEKEGFDFSNFGNKTAKSCREKKKNKKERDLHVEGDEVSGMESKANEHSDAALEKDVITRSETALEDTSSDDNEIKTVTQVSDSSVVSNNSLIVKIQSMEVDSVNSGEQEIKHDEKNNASDLKTKEITKMNSQIADSEKSLDDASLSNRSEEKDTVGKVTLEETDPNGENEISSKVSEGISFNGSDVTCNEVTSNVETTNEVTCNEVTSSEITSNEVTCNEIETSLSNEIDVNFKEDEKVKPEAENNKQLPFKEKVQASEGNVLNELVDLEVEDSDDYLLYLEEILKTIHRAFYDLFDELQGDMPDLKSVIPYVRRKVLSGTHMVFSGLVPTNIPLEKSRVYQVARSLGAVVSPEIDAKTTHLVAIRSGTAKVNTARKIKNIVIVTPEWLWACAERWEHVEEKLYPLGRGQTSSRHPPPHCGSPEHTPGHLTGASRFMDSINPLMSFSPEDIANMDREVEDIFNESESEGEHELDEETKEEEAAVRKAVLEEDSSSSSADSLSGEHPHGWGVDSERRKRTVTDSELDDQDEDMPSTKFRRGEGLPSDLELGEDESASNGSDEPPDEIDDGDWNMMGAALEREFLSGDRD